jgi:phosphatidylglycerol---prolipoprotein diacylglyceryl transferase
MLPYPSISPTIFSLGPFKVRWYGLMYVIGFIATYLLVRRQARRFAWDRLLQVIDDLNLVLILGVVLGGRLGYVLIYNLPFYLAHPLDIFKITEGGMSFHGACLGTLLAGWWFCRRMDIDFWKAADLYVATVPIGLFFGRIGNFINGELYGRVSDLPWAMAFPLGGAVARHPSQLYEALLEGIVLFFLLWSVKSRPWHSSSANWPHGTILALFLSWYGTFRFLVEFVREPDGQLGFLALNLTMGQWWSSGMILGGLLLWWWRRAKKKAGLPA